MNQTLEGISRIVRVTRTPLSVIAIGIVTPIVFSAAIFIFAPIPDTAKYIVGGLPWLVVVAVWFQFWSKAKHEPLSASETYYIYELIYKHVGVPERGTTLEQMEERMRRLNREFRELYEYEGEEPER